VSLKIVGLHPETINTEDMQTIETLLNHKTIRNYKPDPIANDVLNIILEAGFRASTTGNMQVYSVIVTKDEEKRKELCKLHFNQKMVEQAPVLLTFCADFNRFNKWCLQRGAQPGYDNFLSFFTASIDALLVAQNVAVAAEAYGLGICYLGTNWLIFSGFPRELYRLPPLWWGILPKPRKRLTGCPTVVFYIMKNITTILRMKLIRFTLKKKIFL
jgi:hypothetical protein